MGRKNTQDKGKFSAGNKMKAEDYLRRRQELELQISRLKLQGQELDREVTAEILLEAKMAENYPGCQPGFQL